jgi:hypothetical protein
MKEDAPAGRRAATAYDARQEFLQRRVNAAALALHSQGIPPTVTRVRSALGGGSPNDLAPALKHWKGVEFPKLPAGRTTPLSTSRPDLPPQIADLAQEIWQRALAAAVLEAKSGPTSRDVATRTAEAQLLREQLSSLRDQLHRESLAYGELRVQATRHEAIAREALSREHASAARERNLIREVGALRAQIAELQVVVERSRATDKLRAVIRKKPKRGQAQRSRPVARASNKALASRRRAKKRPSRTGRPTL